MIFFRASEPPYFRDKKNITTEALKHGMKNISHIENTDRQTDVFSRKYFFLPLCVCAFFVVKGFVKKKT